MRTILLSLLSALTLSATAQSAFTVESNNKTYSFPLDAVITVTDNSLTNFPEYTSATKAVSMYGTYSMFQMKPMTLIADNIWAGKIMPTGKFKFCAESKTNTDLYLGPAETQTIITSSGKATLGSSSFFQFEEGLKQDSVLVVFNDKTYEYHVFALEHETPLPAGELLTINFEGDTWNSLIDTPEYGGALLYGENGAGWTEDNGVYEWTDNATTLHSKVNNAWGSWCYWNGGAAVSNYNCDIADGGTSHQLSLPTAVVAHSGSNFIVANGYQYESSDTRATLNFADGEEKNVKGLWITNTAYLLNAMMYGGYNSAATAATYMEVVFEGYDSTGNPTNTVAYPIVKGTEYLTDWAYVDLLPLGKVATIKVNFNFSDDQCNDYGPCAPAYIAIDDIEIYSNK